MKKTKIFLGGTCNNSTWRDTLIPLLAVDYFNPVVKDWTPECQAQEIKERETADIVLYVITPKMTGAFSIAEAVDDSNKRPDKTVFVYIDVDSTNPDAPETFTTHQLKSLAQVGKMVKSNGGHYTSIHGFEDLQLVADVLNNK